MEDSEVTILNVYIPPGSDVVLDSSKRFRQTPVHEKLKILMSELGVKDVRRDFHPTEWDYTHYCHPHEVYWRIDYIFIYKETAIEFISVNMVILTCLSLPLLSQQSIEITVHEILYGD